MRNRACHSSHAEAPDFRPRERRHVELKKVNQSFNGTTDIYDSNSITFSGGTPVVLSVTVSNLEMGASYKWRVRTVNIDTHLFSDWQEYGGNASDQADFSITTVVALDLVLSPTTIDLTDRATLTVTATNSLGNADNTYRGTVLFTSTSDTAELPQSYTFTAEDAGVHVFTNELKFFEAGTFIVTAEDTVNATLIDSASITVNEPIIPAISLGSSATDIVFGSVVTLTWQSNLLTDLSLNQGIGGVSTDGNMQITPPLGTTTYTIQGRRADDSILTASVDITATEGELTPTPIDTPTGTPTITPTGTPTGDTPPITPTGTITPTVTHTIRPTRPPPASCPIITVFTVSNRIIKKGDAITVSWQVQNADKVSVDAFSSSVPKSGSASLVLKKSLDITLFASKGTCKRTSVKHVEVVNSYPWEGAGGLLVGLLIIEMVGLQIGAAQGNIWLALIGLIDRSKKRRPWGVVYNAVTKKFVSRAIVRLWNAKSGVLVDTVVTDANGVFKLTPKKGKYVIKVTAAGFTFPSKLIHSDTDSGYTNIYTGEVIEVVDENDLLLFSIPLDPIKEKRKIVVGHMIRVFFEEFVGVIGPIILMAGFIYSIVVTVMYPLTFNYIILGLYGVVFLIKAYLFLSRPKLFGIVTSVDGKIVSGLEIGLFDKEFNTLVSRTFTNKHGAYNFVVENKAYYLQVMDPRYKVLGGQLSKNGILVKESPGKSGVKLVTENLLVYPVQKLVKGKDLKQ